MKEFLTFLENMIYLLEPEFLDMRERLNNYHIDCDDDEIKDMVNDVKKRLDNICDIFFD